MIHMAKKGIPGCTLDTSALYNIIIGLILNRTGMYRNKFGWGTSELVAIVQNWIAKIILYLFQFPEQEPQQPVHPQLLFSPFS